MKTFLEHVAEDIIRKYGTDLSRLVVVFPNKRASLFLNEALVRLAGRPVWSPAYITISQLFRSQSELTVADPIKLVCDLHRSYVEVTGFDETLDHFYGWGQLLLTDFDDIDKHMAPADKVFANLRDYREFDDVSYLSQEQRDVIRKFFSNFTDDHNTLLKERFLRLWSRMGDIYHNFNRRLADQHLAYEGALYRQVAEQLQKSPYWGDSERLYLFVGFNMLQTVEQRLFAYLKAEGKARFYWDFDHYYMKAEACHFISQYLSDFPNELHVDDDNIYRNYQRPKQITFAAAPTEDIQARYISQWLQDVPERISDGRRTAIVLCNEALLPTVVHCLPAAVESVNITTGYPLQQTYVASLVERLIRQYPLSEVISRITQLAKEPETADSPFKAEACFRTYTLLTRLQNLIDSGDLRVDTITLQRLVGQLILQTSIPFHGEPAVGIQVMGVLETRNLDFDHLLLLSTNEGNMPRGITDSSFIPYSLRHAFGLTTADHKSAIYAYYFYRLLSRATDVTIAYSNATVDGQSSEMSRYMLQLTVEDTCHKIAHRTLQAGQSVRLRRPQTVEKSPAVVDTLRRRFASSILSPTAVNRYMRCPLMFYFCYVEGLREPDDTEDGVIDNRVFGNIFHNAAQILYEQLKQRNPHIVASDLDELLKTKVDIERAVDQAFTDEFDGDVPQGGMAVINREVIIHYLRQLVEVDRRLAPFTILELEHDVAQSLPVPSAGMTVKAGGRVDRLDRISFGDGEQIRVIDYKTSARRLKAIKTIDDIFDPAKLADHTDYYLQTLLYARIVSKSQHVRRAAAPSQPSQPLPVAPALLFIQHAGTDDYNPVLKLGNDYIDDVATPDGDRFVKLFVEKVNEIFDPSQPFVPTADTSHCKTCPYAHLCKM
jgi:CRISPR/Cas system-associated exonuclease Cas4 (RecB family)